MHNWQTFTLSYLRSCAVLNKLAPELYNFISSKFWKSKLRGVFFLNLKFEANCEDYYKNWAINTQELHLMENITFVIFRAKITKPVSKTCNDAENIWKFFVKVKNGSNFGPINNYANVTYKTMFMIKSIHATITQCVCLVANTIG